MSMDAAGNRDAVIALGRSGARAVRGAEWTARQEALDRQHCVLLKNFVPPSLLRQIQPLLETRRFAELIHDTSDKRTIASELKLVDSDPLARLLEFVTNQAPLFEAVEAFTGCDGIQAFAGRGLKMNSGHFDSWHNDANGSRRIGLSINLQAAPVCGGEFQIRHTWSDAVQTFPTPRFGDALLFRLGRLLYHRVLPIKGTVPRFCYAGWFVTTPGFVPGIRRHRERRESSREEVLAMGNPP